MKYKGQNKDGYLIIDGEGDTIKLKNEVPQNGIILRNFIFDSSGIKVLGKELIKKKFQELKEKWKKETCYLSDPTLIHNNKNYREIIKMGKDVIPFILEDLGTEPNFWMRALEEISGENILEENGEYSGMIKVAISLWLKWGKEKGYVE